MKQWKDTACESYLIEIMFSSSPERYGLLLYLSTKYLYSKYLTKNIREVIPNNNEIPELKVIVI